MRITDLLDKTKRIADSCSENKVRNSGYGS